MRVGDGESIVLGQLRMQRDAYARAHADSMCLAVEDRVFTGDTLLIGATGRTDLPTGDPEALYDSLFNRVLRLDPALAGLSGTRVQEAAATRPSAQEIETTRACRSGIAPSSWR